VRGWKRIYAEEPAASFPALVSALVTAFEGNRCAVTVIRRIFNLKKPSKGCRDGEETLRRNLRRNTDAAHATGRKKAATSKSTNSSFSRRDAPANR